MLTPARAQFAKPKSLQHKIGGRAADVMEQTVARFERALVQQSATFAGVIASYANDVRLALAAKPVDVDALYQGAHRIREIAGTFGYLSFARMADALCKYIEGYRRAGRPVDAQLAATLATGLLRGQTPDAHATPELKELADAAQAAVLVRLAALSPKR